MAKKPMRTAVGRGQDRAATTKAMDEIGYSGGKKITALNRERVSIKKAGKRMATAQAALAGRSALQTRPKAK